MRKLGAAVGLLCATAAIAQVTVATVGGANALSTVSQRHLVRVVPAGRSATFLMAVERDWLSPPGLHWYRSDDEGRSWRYYQQLFDDSSLGPPLHFTTDLLPMGEDVAVVISYDTTATGFPSDEQDPRCGVLFQRWAYDGAGGWAAGPLKTIASPPDGSAYHRATLARDSRGRLWVQAWLRGSCPVEAGAACPDSLRLWVSSDEGASFTAQPALYDQPTLGGGRLISLGSRLMMLWGDYSWDNPALYAVRDDAAALGQWDGPYQAFPDGDTIYHGAALNAVADGSGGLHLVYKDRHSDLYYRRFDGSAFGARQRVDGSPEGDWALQPAITWRGGELFVCTNHTTSSAGTHELRMYRLSAGFSKYEVLDATSSFKGYPSAPEALPPDAPLVPCAYAAGGWPSTLKVALTQAGELPPPPPPPPPPGPGMLSSLVDPFSGPAVDASLWTVTRLTAGDAVSAGGGELALSTAASNPAAGVFVTSVKAYDLRGSGAAIKVRGVVSSGGYITQRVRVHPALPGGWSDDLGFWFEYGTLSAYRTVGGSPSEVGSVSYSAATHAWWRIREAAGTLYWETSPDGTTWTGLAQAPSSRASFPLDEVHLSFETKGWGAGAASPGVARYAELNAGWGLPVPDAGSVDGGAGKDAGTADAGTPDAGTPDAGTPDAGTPDAGTPDAGTPDAGTPDAGTSDAGTSDAGTSDAGTSDAGTPDAGTPDAGTPDAGTADAGTSDAGTADAGTSDAGTADAGAPADGGIALISTLQDDFTGPAIDRTKWLVLEDSPGSQASALGGFLTFTLEPNSAAAGVHVSSSRAYALTGSSVQVKADAVTHPAAQANTVLVVIPRLDSWDTQAGFWYEQGLVYLFHQSPEGVSAVGVLVYSPVSHAYWRLRETGGTLHWETSSDGTTWAVRAQTPTSALGFDAGSVHLRFDSKAWGGGSADPGAARFGRLNR